MLKNEKSLTKLYDDLIKQETLLKKEGLSVDEMADKLEVLTEGFAVELSKHPEAKKILTEYLGKLRLDGKVGDSRPDFMVISLLEGNSVFDFIHAKTSLSHFTGTQYYQTVGQVLFGKATDTVTVDIIYKLKF